MEDEAVESIINRAEDTITKNGGTLIETERWGRRKLAYEIERHANGFYTSIHFSAPGSVIAKLERMYQLDENVLRWLTLQMPETSIQGRAAMKKRIEDVAARRAADAAAAELGEQNAATTNAAE